MSPSSRTNQEHPLPPLEPTPSLHSLMHRRHHYASKHASNLSDCSENCSSLGDFTRFAVAPDMLALSSFLLSQNSLSSTPASPSIPGRRKEESELTTKNPSHIYFRRTNSPPPCPAKTLLRIVGNRLCTRRSTWSNRTRG